MAAINNRIRRFLKMAGGATTVAKKSELSKATLSNLANKDSNPSFNVIHGIFKAYPALNFKWFLFGGDQQMWSDIPKDIDKDLDNYKPIISTKNVHGKIQDYSSFSREQLEILLEEKDRALDAIKHEKEGTISLARQQLNVMKKILETIENQGATD